MIIFYIFETRQSQMEKGYHNCLRYPFQRTHEIIIPGLYPLTGRGTPPL